MLLLQLAERIYFQKRSWKLFSKCLTKYKKSIKNIYINNEDGSGSITTDELNTMFSNGQLKVSDNVWKKLVSEVDKNGDGKVDLYE